MIVLVSLVVDVLEMDVVVVLDALVVVVLETEVMVVLVLVEVEVLVEVDVDVDVEDDVVVNGNVCVDDVVVSGATSQNASVANGFKVFSFSSSQSTKNTLSMLPVILTSSDALTASAIPIA